MRNFITTNYFKLITSISLLFFSLGFFLFSINSLKANDNSTKLIKKDIPNPGDTHTAGIGIKDDYAYLVDYEVDGRNHYYKIPLRVFKYSSDSGVE